MYYAGWSAISGEYAINNRIEEFRARHDLTQDDLAKKCAP
jgi:hypothetical protein